MPRILDSSNALPLYSQISLAPGTKPITAPILFKGPVNVGNPGMSIAGASLGPGGGTPSTGSSAPVSTSITTNGSIKTKAKTSMSPLMIAGIVAAAVFILREA